MALGELIEESRGKTTNERVLDVDPPKVVTSFKMEGNFKGTLCTEIGSYTAVLGEGGILQGEGYGIITSKDGQGMATWKGQEKSVSVAQYSLKYLQQLREENCQISITWWECLNTRLTKTEIAPLKPGNGNRQRPRLLNPLTNFTV